MSEESFLSRWSRRKQAPPEEVKAEDARVAMERPQPAAGGESEGANAASAQPVLPDIESLTPEADFTPFMQAKVPAALKNAALKKLFADPHFNVMDGLDTYIDDYTKSDPIPLDMMRKLVQSRALKLFDYSAEEAAEKLEREQAQGAEPTEPAAAGQAEGRAAPLDSAPSSPVSAITPPLAASTADAPNASGPEPVRPLTTPAPDGASQ